MDACVFTDNKNKGKITTQKTGIFAHFFFGFLLLNLSKKIIYIYLYNDNDDDDNNDIKITRSI